MKVKTDTRYGRVLLFQLKPKTLDQWCLGEPLSHEYQIGRTYVWDSNNYAFNYFLSNWIMI